MATILDYLERKAEVIRRGVNTFIECPGCNTRKAKCSIHIHKGIGNCFRASCSLHGGFTFPDLIVELEKVPFSEALSIAARYSDEVEREYQAKSFGLNRNYPTNALPIQEALNKSEHTSDKLLYFLALHATNYLVQERELTLEQIQSYQIGVGYEDFEVQNPDSKTATVVRYGMLIIPVFFNREIVSYIGRSIEVDGDMLGRQKHTKPEEGEDYLKPGQILFNCDVAIPAARKKGYLAIVEDAWSGIKLDAVASLGSNLSEDQIYILTNNYDGPIVICRDNDKGGNEAAHKDALKLTKYYRDVRIAVPIGIDPDDNLAETLKVIEAAVPIDPFKLKLSHLLK